MTCFLILVLLMVTEIIVENIHIHKVKQGMEDLEDEVVRLKAKLYDQTENEG